MGKRAGRSPVVRARDVVPAAVSVVLLLGVAGCMGAFGGGPLDGGSTPTISASVREVVPDEALAEADPEASPSLIAGEADEGTPGYLFDFADKLAESKSAGNAPRGFLDRSSLFSCGEFVLGQGAVEPREGWDCLAARLETGAELVVVSPTIEGDPVITYYRVGPDIAGIEVFEDSSFDKFGSGRWALRRCSLEPAGTEVVVGSCTEDDNL